MKNDILKADNKIIYKMIKAFDCTFFFFFILSFHFYAKCGTLVMHFEARTLGFLQLQFSPALCSVTASYL